MFFGAWPPRGWTEYEEEKMDLIDRDALIAALIAEKDDHRLNHSPHMRAGLSVAIIIAKKLKSEVK